METPKHWAELLSFSKDRKEGSYEQGGLRSFLGNPQRQLTWATWNSGTLDCQLGIWWDQTRPCECGWSVWRVPSSGIRTYPMEHELAFWRPFPMLGYFAQPWQRGEVLGPALTCYARLCWHPRGSLTPSEEWIVDEMGGGRTGEEEGELGLVYNMKKILNKKKE